MQRLAQFVKYEGLGNDFIVVDAADAAEISPALAARLCDRRRGVGGDGVLLVLPSRRADCAVRMRVINADGSIPEMCGNGVRCVAVHALLAGRTSRDVAAAVAVDTDAGVRTCQVEGADDEALVTVDMGITRTVGSRHLALDDGAYDLALADAGNPHAVLFGTFSDGDIASIGPRIATHAAFPHGTNVEFARVDAGGIDLVVWERGVGVTLACGTGACATVAVAAARGLVPHGEPIRVRLPGGVLTIRVDDGGRTTMRGPARRVFAGTVDLS